MPPVESFGQHFFLLSAPVAPERARSTPPVPPETSAATLAFSSTDTSVLFGGVQGGVAQLHGLSKETIIATQAAGSAYGNAIAPANIVLGTGVAGVKGQEGAVLRQTVPWTIIVAVLTGLATVALVLMR